MLFSRKIRNFFRSFGYEISKLGNIDILEQLIYKNQSKDFYFIQIGANDGKSFDPIFNIVNELKISGLVIEPVKEYYDELVENYKKNKNVLPINKAIHEKSGYIELFRPINNHDTPSWTKGIASINPKHFLKSGFLPSNTKIESIKVEAITFHQLFESYNVKNVDLLQIDTEGYDYNLIKLFPFNLFKPRMIHFEHGLNDKVMSKEQFSEIINLLINKDYRIITKEYDCIAYL